MRFRGRAPNTQSVIGQRGMVAHDVTRGSVCRVSLDLNSLLVQGSQSSTAGLARPENFASASPEGDSSLCLCSCHMTNGAS